MYFSPKEKSIVETEVPSGYELPSNLVKKAYFQVIDSLPDYIDKEYIEKIKRTHEAPNIYCSLGIKIQDTPPLFPPIDSEIQESDVENWRNGIILLDEFCNQKLTMDVLKKAEPSFLRILDLSSHVANYINKIEVEKGLNPELIKYSDQLTNAMFTGNLTLANEISQKLGYSSIDEMAVELGKQFNYSKEPKDQSIFEKLLDKVTTSGYFIPPKNIQLNISMQSATLILDLITNAFVLPKITKEISFLNLLSYMMLTVAGFSAITTCLGLPSNAVHEILHYLSNEEKRSGLIRSRE